MSDVVEIASERMTTSQRAYTPVWFMHRFTAPSADFRDFAIFSLLFALSPIDRTHTHYAEREWDSETVRQAEAPRTLGGAASSRQCGGPAVRGARREEVSLCCARSLALSPSFSHTLAHSLSAALYSSSERSRHRIVSLAVVVVPSRTQWLASF